MQGIANTHRLAPPFDRGGSLAHGDVRNTNGRAASLGLRRQAGVAAGALDGIGGLGWSVLGFVAGAIFWHFVGFWGFVSSVVFANNQATGPDVAVAQRAPVIVVSQPVSTGATGSSHCSTVSRDRSTGVTSVRPCDGDPPTLPQDAYQGRQDRIDVNASNGWEPLSSDDGFRVNNGY
jgi:hypothetical protein